METFEKLEIELQGVTNLQFITPENKRWNKTTLASLGYGYSVSPRVITAHYILYGNCQ